jgi:NAD(P)-dependent dehydrogenase (short-subunit alcohol dehydrogenase family)
MNNYKNLFNNKKKMAFVIGGNGLIGKEICNALQYSGCKVISLDHKHKLRKKNKINLLTKKYFNCSDYENLKSNFDEIVNEFGTPDIFINASYPRSEDWANNSFDGITKKSFKKNIELHLYSYVWLAKHAADQMKSKKVKGSIIQLSSIYGVNAQDMSIYENTKMKESMTYSIIKGGINQLTKQMASYYGKYRIRINAICPGGIREKKHNKIFIKNYLKKVPLKRFCRPQDVAASALFLSSDASSYITGTIFMVDGGWTSV